MALLRWRRRAEHLVGSRFFKSGSFAILNEENSNNELLIKFGIESIAHGGKNVSIIKDTCIPRGLFGQSTDEANCPTNIDFSWMSFMMVR
jgi:hypothetical protein